MKRNFNRISATLRLLLPVVMLSLTDSVRADNGQLMWCLRTDRGQYIEMARVSMLAAVDGQETFEVVVKNGRGATGVKSITFELHESDYVAPDEGEPSPDNQGTGPWCLITDANDSIAMSRVLMLANVDGSNQFEVVTTDGDNRLAVSHVRFARGLSEASGGFAPIDPSVPQPVDPNLQNPWCMITDQHDTIAMSRVQMLANVDGNSHFEIVTTDGDNRTGIRQVRFAHGDSKTAGGFVPIKPGETPTDPNRYNPWCMITDRKDTIAMSRVQMIANVDRDNTFEVVLSDGANIAGTQYVRFAHGDSKTAGGFVPIKPGDTPPADAGTGPWCLITDRGDSVAMGRVAMLANVDANGHFEILTKYGEGVTDVRNVRFARGLNDLSGGFDPNYHEGGEQPAPPAGPIILVTDKGSEQPMSNVAMLANIDANGRFEVVLHAGQNITGVEYVTFRIDGGDQGVRQPSHQLSPLTLLTPVRFELRLSGCDDATQAVVYDAAGRQVATAPVAGGSTTIQVAHLTAGVYVVSVGNKALKFTKQ